MSIKEHQTDILTGLGIVGMAAGAVAAGINGPKIKEAVEQRKKELGVEKLPFKEFFKVSWRHLLIPVTAVTGGATCVILAHVGDKKAAAGYAVAYAASEAALTECKDKIVEVVGEKKSKEIEEAIAKDHAQADPIDGKNVYIVDGGDHLMRFDWNGYSFRSTVQKVEHVVNELNARVNEGEAVSVADFCYEFGKDYCPSDEKYIWDINRNGLIRLTKSGDVDTSGEPYIIWIFENRPIWDEYNY